MITYLALGVLLAGAVALLSASMIVLAFWSPIRRASDRPPVATAAQAPAVTMAIAGWL